jgi:transposase
MEKRAETPKTTEEWLQQQAELERENAELKMKLRWYEEQLQLAKHRRFAASSEQTHPDQLTLFNEAEAEADPAIPEPTVETITYQRKKKAGSREANLESLPVETIEYRLSEGEQVCPCCAGKLHEMSTQVRRELKLIPAEVKVVEHVRHVYACRRCEKEEIYTPILTAPMPAPVIAGSLASPSIVAYIMSQKYADSEQWLAPLYDYMHAELLKRDIAHADETTLQVLHEPGRVAQAKSYLWLYRTGRMGPDIILYDYQPGRGGEHPSQFLAGFTGYLQTDGYSGYNQVKGVTQLGCWSHARRKYHEALQVVPAAQRAQTAAAEGLQFCNALFEVERKWKDATPEERYAARLAESKPILEQFSAWLESQRLRVLPKGLLGTAITYCLNQWEKLNVFLQDGRLEIHNNRSERSIKPVVIGRKNFLFSNTPRGATASAIIYSIVETAKANDLKPQAYLQYLFEQLPQLEDVKDHEALKKLAPWSPSLPLICRNFKK